MDPTVEKTVSKMTVSVEKLKEYEGFVIISSLRHEVVTSIKTTRIKPV